MRKVSIGLIVMAALAVSVSSPAVTVLKLTFDSAATVDEATYVFAPADIPPSGTVSIYYNHPYVADERDYGLEVCAATDLGNYPDIVTPATASTWQGGNALYTNEGTPADPCKHIGYYINEDNGIAIDGDFTAEAVFMITRLNPNGSEYGLQNIFGNDKVIDATRGLCGWKFRVFPVGVLEGGVGQIQLWTPNTVSFWGENNIDGPTVTAGVWHHVACVYNSTSNTMEMFYDGTSAGTTTPAYGDTKQNQWWVAEWPSNCGARQLAGWIDAVALSDTTLTPSQFKLQAGNVEQWKEY